MPKETFMLVSLKEDKARKLAQAISNPTCRKILDFLANKEATETELSERLSIPLSTVHYNLSQLKDSKLVETEEFHYSTKGKEILHYKLANKYIIIAPRDSSGFMEKLKTLLPVSLILAAGVWIWQSFDGSKTIPLVMRTAVSPEQALYAKSAADVLAPQPLLVSQIAQQTGTWPIFVYGAIAALILYVLVDSIRKHIFK